MAPSTVPFVLFTINYNHFSLGFEFRWGVNRWGKPILKRRTSRKKLKTSLANYKVWFIKTVVYRRKSCLQNWTGNYADIIMTTVFEETIKA